MDEGPTRARYLTSFEAGLRECLVDDAASAADLGFRGKRCVFRDLFGGLGQIIAYLFDGGIRYAMGGLLDGTLFAIMRGIISGADCRF